MNLNEAYMLARLKYPQAACTIVPFEQNGECYVKIGWSMNDEIYKIVNNELVYIEFENQFDNQVYIWYY